LAKGTRLLNSEPLAQEQRALTAPVDDRAQNGNELRQQRDAAVGHRLAGPAQLGLATDQQPAAGQVDVLDQQMNQFTRTQPRLGQREVNTKAPWPGCREERQLLFGVEDEDRLGVADADVDRMTRGERVGRARPEHPVVGAEAVETAAALYDVSNSLVGEPAPCRVRVAIGGNLDRAEGGDERGGRDCGASTIFWSRAKFSTYSVAEAYRATVPTADLSACSWWARKHARSAPTDIAEPVLATAALLGKPICPDWARSSPQRTL
jgi:hypothetical protein